MVYFALRTSARHKQTAPLGKNSRDAPELISLLARKKRCQLSGDRLARGKEGGNVMCVASITGSIAERFGGRQENRHEIY